MENTLTNPSLNLYLSMKDHFSKNAIKTMRELLRKHNQRRFEAAFEDAFVKIHIEADGDWAQKSTRDKFMSTLTRIVNSFSAKPLTEALSKTVKHVAMVFGEDCREKANDLLQDCLIALKRSKKKNDDIVKKFQEMRELTECADSYADWAAAIQVAPIKVACCCPFIQSCVKLSPSF